jgi:hypothetical protein
MAPQDETTVRRKILRRLPARIFDSHRHANGADAVIRLSEFAWTQTRSSFPQWSVLDGASVEEHLYGSAQVRSLWFAQPYKGIDHRVANLYLLESKRPGDLVALCGDPEDREYTITALESGLYAALKMYPFMAEPPYTSLHSYFPDWSVAAAASAGLPLILHLPLPLAESLSELETLVGRHPDVKICLAHLGRHHHVDATVERAFRRAAEIPGIMLDTSMAADTQVHALALETFGPERIMFGSDEPFNLLRYRKIVDPEFGRLNVGAFPYHWENAAAAARHRAGVRNALLLHWQVLDAMFGAVDAADYADPEGVVARLMWTNGVAFYGAAGRHGPGLG